MPLVAESFYNVVIFIRHEIIIPDQTQLSTIGSFAGPGGFMVSGSAMLTIKTPSNHYVGTFFSLNWRMYRGLAI